MRRYKGGSRQEPPLRSEFRQPKPIRPGYLCHQMLKAVPRLMAFSMRLTASFTFPPAHTMRRPGGFVIPELMMSPGENRMVGIPALHGLLIGIQLAQRLNGGFGAVPV